MDFFLAATLSGILVGGLYALVALGFVLIFKATGVLNFAQGELVMLGGYIAWSLLVLAALPLWLGLLLTLVAGGILGLLVNRFFIRPLIAQPVMSTIMMTIAVSAVLTGITVLIWGSAFRSLPKFLPMGSIHLGEITLSQGHATEFVVALVAVGILSLFFYRTRRGLMMRSTAENDFISLSLGINVKGVIAMAWAISAGLSAIGGIALGSISGVSLYLSTMGLMVLPVVILGGLDSIAGAVIAGLLMGVLQNLASLYLDPLVGGGMGEVFPFIVMTIVLIIRPTGLFGSRRIERV